jgi:hypothetical protein
MILMHFAYWQVPIPADGHMLKDVFTFLRQEALAKARGSDYALPRVPR